MGNNIPLEDFKIIDLSHTLSNEMPMTVPYGHVTWISMDKGDFCYGHCLFLGEHHGTHIDAPGHIIQGGGDLTVEKLPLSSFMGSCVVINLTDKKNDEFVRPQDIEKWEDKHGIIEEGEITLMYFGWDKNWKVPSPAAHYTVKGAGYYKNWPGLSVEAAKLLVERKIKFIGTDAPSIDAYPIAGPPEPEPCHPILQLSPLNVIVCEGLENLGQLPPRGAFFIGLPIKIKNGSGSPIRAVAFVKR
jgi:kynurenine formamidase